MIFVRNYPRSETISNVLKDVAKYADCADEVKIARLDHGVKVTIDAEDEHGFLKCAAKHVDSQTLEAWEHELEEAEEDSDFSGPHSREGFKATGSKIDRAEYLMAER